MCDRLWWRNMMCRITTHGGKAAQHNFAQYDANMSDFDRDLSAHTTPQPAPPEPATLSPLFRASKTRQQHISSVAHRGSRRRA